MEDNFILKITDKSDLSRDSQITAQILDEKIQIIKNLFASKEHEFSMETIYLKGDSCIITFKAIMINKEG